MLIKIRHFRSYCALDQTKASTSAMRYILHLLSGRRFQAELSIHESLILFRQGGWTGRFLGGEILSKLGFPFLDCLILALSDRLVLLGREN